MKKFLSFSLALGVVVASVFTPFTNAEASTVSKAESLVRTAEQHAGALKWQISVELTKEVKYPDMKIFNLTKDAYLKAKQEIARTNTKDKAVLQKRLEANVGVHYSRATGYIDAITTGKKIVDKTTQFNKLYAANPTSDLTEASYHALSREIRKQATLLYRVYGNSTRNAILVKYKSPGEKALQSSINIVSAKMQLDTLNGLITKKADQATVEANSDKFYTLLGKIENEQVWSVLHNTYILSIRKDTSFLTQQQEIIELFKKYEEYENAENTESLFSLYSQKYPQYSTLKEEIKTSFEKNDINYKTLGIEVELVVEGMAIVIHNQSALNGTTEEVEYITYLLSKDEAGQWKFEDVLDVN
ncbi:hypothetical protein [Paenisporosarcina sp. NPDC076898]|uniref:hypothetical protein n=1 Tax=unclassified Paenisporosarcina TaxID=2642018 RepID=UPI003D03676B